MAGNLTFDQLKKAVAAGDIDTVIASAVDMQGRLVGKRFLAKYFVESAYDETHGCNYLLANDIDMEPVPGYKAASWSKGYGDFVMKPDLADAPQRAVAGKDRAAFRATSSTITRMTTCRIRRAPSCAPGQAAEGARLPRLFRLGARVLSVRRNLQVRAREALAEPRYRLDLYRGLP